MGTKLNTLDVHVPHEIDKDEIELCSSEWSQKFVVQSFFRKIELIREVQKFHTEDFFHLLVFDEALCGL